MESHRPERLSLTDLESQESIECMFNPNELRRRIAVSYAQKGVLGNSHTNDEYLFTESQSLTFDLFYNVETPDDLRTADTALKFLESLAYAPANPESISRNAPPRVLLVWPNTLVITARLDSLDLTYNRWNSYGNITQFTARCSWRESRITRITKQDIRQLGGLRPSSDDGGGS